MRKVLTSIILMVVVAVSGCGPVVTVDKGVMSVSIIQGQELSVNPAKTYLKLSEGEQVNLPIMIENEGHNYLDLDIELRTANYLENGYKEYSPDNTMWVVIPTKKLHLEGGGHEIVNIIVGLPEAYELPEPTELWLFISSTEGNPRLEMVSRILIERR